MRYYRQPYPNELWHYGISGQKWGVRRFQNPDGTLTEAGKRRYLVNKEYVDDAETGRYELTKAGIKAERKAHDKLYGKGSYKTFDAKRDASQKKMRLDSKTKPTDELMAASYIANQAADQFLSRHYAEVKSGRLFTDEYFRSRAAWFAMKDLQNSVGRELFDRGYRYTVNGWKRASP